MELLYILEQIRTPFLDQIMLLLTELASEVFFILVAVILFWCVSKGKGLYILCVSCFGLFLNQFLKMACRVPRPWERDPSFTIVEQAREGAGGYSFPSGHTQNAGGIFGSLAMLTRSRWKRIGCAAAILAVAFTRLYLGVHTLQDVLFSLLLSAVVVVSLFPLFRDLDSRPVRGVWILAGLLGVSLVFLVYALVQQAAGSGDPGHLESAVVNACKFIGAIAGMLIAWCIDMKWIHFRTDASMLGNILKCAVGLALMLALKSGLKPILGEGCFGGALRYAVLTLFAGCIWPMTFPFFAKLGRKKA